MNAAWVPLPAPGPPSKIRRIGPTPRERLILVEPRIIRWRAEGCHGAPCSRSSGVSTPASIAPVPEGHRDAVAVAQRAQLLERLEALGRRRRERGVLAQEAHAVGVDADVAIGGEALGQALARRARRRRARRESARARSTARSRRCRRRPSRRSGSKKVVGVVDRMRRGGDRGVGAQRPARVATLRTSCGSMSGSSPCTFTTISSSAEAQQLAPPRRGGRCRSGASGEVVHTFAAARARRHRAISWWSVAITTSSAPLARARSATHATSGLPRDVGEHLARQARRAHARRDR